MGKKSKRKRDRHKKKGFLLTPKKEEDINSPYYPYNPEKEV